VNKLRIERGLSRASPSLCTVIRGSSWARAAYAERGKCAHDRPKGVVDTTGAAGSLTRLASAPTEADLVKTLKGKGPCTMFAPTDKAFAKLPKATVEQLLGPEIRESLTAILAYHVVPGKVMAADVVELRKAKTTQASELAGRVEEGKVSRDKSRVTKKYISCRNGVIHVIDDVLRPE